MILLICSGRNVTKVLIHMNLLTCNLRVDWMVETSPVHLWLSLTLPRMTILTSGLKPPIERGHQQHTYVFILSWVCTFNFYYFNLYIVGSLLLKFCQTRKTVLYIFINACNIHSQISLVLLNVVSFYNLCNVV